MEKLMSDQWRNIETAPRDGTEFLGYHLSTDGYTGDWFVLIEGTSDLDWPWQSYEGSHPFEFLTHWMPLPAPPETTP
jgi:hypothetical protein